MFVNVPTYKTGENNILSHLQLNNYLFLTNENLKNVINNSKQLTVSGMQALLFIYIINECFHHSTQNMIRNSVLIFVQTHENLSVYYKPGVSLL